MTVASPPLLRGDGASAQNRRSTRLATPLGDMLVAVSDDGVLGAYFDGQAHQPDAAWFGARVEQRDDALLDAAAQQLTARRFPSNLSQTLVFSLGERHGLPPIARWGLRCPFPRAELR